jgi:hypothetical protein
MAETDSHSFPGCVHIVARLVDRSAVVGTKDWGQPCPTVPGTGPSLDPSAGNKKRRTRTDITTIVL